MIDWKGVVVAEAAPVDADLIGTRQVVDGHTLDDHRRLGVARRTKASQIHMASSVLFTSYVLLIGDWLPRANQEKLQPDFGC